MFFDCPTPAVPLNPFASAVRAGSADGLLVVRVVGDAAGAAFATVEAAISAAFSERAGEFVGRTLGLIVGSLDVCARKVCARASSVDGDLEGTSIACGDVLLAVACDDCRATADDDGAGDGLSDCTGDLVGAVTAAATLVGEGLAVVAARRSTTGLVVCAIVGEVCASCCRDWAVTEISVTAVGCDGVGSVETFAAAAVLVVCLLVVMPAGLGELLVAVGCAAATCTACALVGTSAEVCATARDGDLLGVACGLAVGTSDDCARCVVASAIFTG